MNKCTIMVCATLTVAIHHTRQLTRRQLATRGTEMRNFYWHIDIYCWISLMMMSLCYRLSNTLAVIKAYQSWTSRYSQVIATWLHLLSTWYISILFYIRWYDYKGKIHKIKESLIRLWFTLNKIETGACTALWLAGANEREKHPMRAPNAKT